MNTCMCEQCKGKGCHYSMYYHREDGFDAMHNRMVKEFQERVIALESVIDSQAMQISRLERGNKK